MWEPQAQVKKKVETQHGQITRNSISLGDLFQAKTVTSAPIQDLVENSGPNLVWNYSAGPAVSNTTYFIENLFSRL